MERSSHASSYRVHPGLRRCRPVVASDWEGGKTVVGYQHVEGHKASAEYLNIGGPYGITYGEAKKAHFEAERGYFYNQYLHGR